MDFKCLMPSFLQTLVPYESPCDGAKENTVWLNTNEYPEATVCTMRFESLNRYPEVQPRLFCERYAAYAGVTSKSVLVTRGADEAIELLIRTFCVPGNDRVLYAKPTYSMYAISSQTCGVSAESVPPTALGDVDIEAFIRRLTDKSQTQSVKLAFFCNPNNPTGEVYGLETIEAILKAMPSDVLLAVDEAYIEFSPTNSAAPLMSQYPNLVIIRTLSKAFALAGLRCGVVLADSSVIACLKKVIAPYPVPEPVARIAEEALTEKGIKRMKERVKEIETNRVYLVEALRKLPGLIRVYETRTNFVLIALENASEVYEALWQKGIAVRNPGKDNTLRISVGTRAECEMVVNVLGAILREKIR